MILIGDLEFAANRSTNTISWLTPECHSRMQIIKFWKFLGIIMQRIDRQLRLRWPPRNNYCKVKLRPKYSIRHVSMTHLFASSFGGSSFRWSSGIVDFRHRLVEFLNRLFGFPDHFSVQLVYFRNRLVDFRYQTCGVPKSPRLVFSSLVSSISELLSFSSDIDSWSS